jgi:hypothetical protein
MNERIKELIKQATTIEEHKWGVSYDNFDKEKFAELIVRECANWIENTDSDPDIGADDAQALREHFGVEE